MQIILLFVCSNLQAYNRSVELKKLSELVQKYHIHHTDFAEWSDSLPIKDRLDLNNKNFSVAYPKCLRVEAPEAGAESADQEKEVLNSSTLYFFINGDCDYKEISKKTNEYVFSIEGNVLKEIDQLKCHKNMFYCQLLKINKTHAMIYGTVNLPDKNTDNYLPLIKWQIEFFCYGKNNESYKSNVTLKPEPDLETYLNKKNLEPPDYFKQIMSTFRCAKEK